MTSQGLPPIADDQVGRASRVIATLMLSAGADLLAAGRQHAGEDRIAFLTRAFQVWPMICRHVADLEVIAPRSAAAGMEIAEDLREIALAVGERHDRDGDNWSKRVATERNVS